MRIVDRLMELVGGRRIAASVRQQHSPRCLSSPVDDERGPARRRRTQDDLPSGRLARNPWLLIIQTILPSTVSLCLSACLRVCLCFNVSMYIIFIGRCLSVCLSFFLSVCLSLSTRHCQHSFLSVSVYLRFSLSLFLLHVCLYLRFRRCLCFSSNLCCSCKSA